MFLTVCSDVNNDGLVDTVDATAVLIEYAALSANKDSTLETGQSMAGDINNDNLVDAVDAAGILTYYAYLSTGGELEFAEYLSSQSE